MTTPKDVAEIVTEELLLLRQKIQEVLADGTRSFEDAQDANFAYVSVEAGRRGTEDDWVAVSTATVSQGFHVSGTLTPQV